MPKEKAQAELTQASLEGRTKRHETGLHDVQCLSVSEREAYLAYAAGWEEADAT